MESPPQPRRFLVCFPLRGREQQPQNLPIIRRCRGLRTQAHTLHQCTAGRPLGRGARRTRGEPSHCYRRCSWASCFVCLQGLCKGEGSASSPTCSHHSAAEGGSGFNQDSRDPGAVPHPGLHAVLGSTPRGAAAAQHPRARATAGQLHRAEREARPAATPRQLTPGCLWKRHFF